MQALREAIDRFAPSFLSLHNAAQAFRPGCLARPPAAEWGCPQFQVVTSSVAFNPFGFMASASYTTSIETGSNTTPSGRKNMGQPESRELLDRRLLHRRALGRTRFSRSIRRSTFFCGVTRLLVTPFQAFVSPKKKTCAAHASSCMPHVQTFPTLGEGEEGGDATHIWRSGGWRDCPGRHQADWVGRPWQSRQPITSRAHPPGWDLVSGTSLGRLRFMAHTLGGTWRGWEEHHPPLI